MTASVECNGTITGGTFTGAITGDGKLEGGDFTAADLDDFDGTVGAGAIFDGYSIANGKLTVTGDGVTSNDIPSFASIVSSIEIAAGAGFILNRDSNFSGDILIADGGFFSIEGTISGGTITVHGLLYLQPYGEITGSANVKIEGNVAHFDAMGKITGGTFTGTVNNTGSISGGDFTEATVENFDGSITGGKFSNIALDHKSGELTITGDVDLSNGGTLAPLTIGVTDGSIKSITVEKDGMFNAGVGDGWVRASP